MGWLPSAESPAMVVTFLPETLDTGVLQERRGCPSIWTVQAPQRPMPQPNLVPVRPRVSRRTHNNGICDATSTLCCRPLTVKLIAAKLPSPGDWNLFKNQDQGSLEALIPVKGKIRREMARRLQIRLRIFVFRCTCPLGVGCCRNELGALANWQFESFATRSLRQLAKSSSST